MFSAVGVWQTVGKEGGMGWGGGEIRHSGRVLGKAKPEGGAGSSSQVQAGNCCNSGQTTQTQR